MVKDIDELSAGTYAAPAPNALRCPCPMLNTLANHGYLPRDGREAGIEHFREAMRAAGVSSALGAFFYRPIFLEIDPAKHPTDVGVSSVTGDAVPRRSFFGRLWYQLTHPLTIIFAAFGMRHPNQCDPQGRPCLNLNQISLHNAVEHDISISRHDVAQGDNHTPQPELIQELLAASSDGVVVTAEDFAAHRRRRITEQKKINPAAVYSSIQHRTACGEIVLLLQILGDGKSVRCDYLKAFFEQERLPFEEGWKQPSGSSVLGLFRFLRIVETMRKLVNVKV